MVGWPSHLVREKVNYGNSNIGRIALSTDLLVYTMSDDSDDVAVTRKV